MEVLKFNLSGETAFFKRPDVNTYLYFTYGNIHKVALLGILGAIMGYKGYNNQCNKIYKHEQEQSVYPEFYEKLKGLKVGIVPINHHGYNLKKVQTFNNSVGYASQEKGGNLIVKEQWLEKPKWEIYILIENEITRELADRLKNYRFKYIPYLGKNDHIADINHVEVIKTAENIQSVDKLDGLFIGKDFTLNLDNEDEEEDILWKYEESLPVALEEVTNKYELETFLMTNAAINIKDHDKVQMYKCNDKNIYFF
ncbi:type I-B CRISPR-associated protein Cas5b [Clostridium botulinum]|uniref:type I-B CRISPR-associated protein Cas5b n=1 Tax=Clostridium botulinum TaxID=1491 RepID=UPI00064CD90A|nr:type I-B CRISPR-associated protein Cas5b [Clostridium botulinum]KLU76821.1 CRISPR-associated protein Cas5 [Clostridium botulinum V891]KOA91005.1 CRISPR-associated protein Cas5 [Clostridium botulinum]MCD3204252.1 type I-B CRISPR-associated protein Cas5 [Clostridium botulinum C/D]MCD3224016.1 type I-B CRISPR-associated protein Cas5 [Clostridium botulinum C/D]MCD3231662.1 type I-B CRISPR-associated protein Cas5 [Clostridium botulinum C/D]